MRKTLEQYLADDIGRGVIDHHLRASRDADGKVTFYIHPAGVDGDTLDYVVRGNVMAPNVTSDSDVVIHASDCSTNNRGVPELLGPCDCEHAANALAAAAAPAIPLLDEVIHEQSEVRA